jgi:hypothetical protein
MVNRRAISITTGCTQSSKSRAAARSGQATSETTLEALQQSVIGKDYPAPRKYPADEVMGLVKMKGTLLTLEEEKEVLIQALLEKYG